MNYLAQGQEPQLRIELLIQLTRIDSDSVIGALEDHYVKGLEENLACDLNGIKRSALSRAKTRLEEVAQKHEQLKEIEWPDYSAFRKHITGKC
ncbi:hypothetical protein JQC92_02520 [Shewanella sp. 202IG2-18]|uniref:PapB/FocB family fimbrial expression transcriptional regulator n=1 Tax=Parashewanella hymeniacidonis TaxID=2807618 RepID=UPI001960C40C|nr:PapB/FocB family fimbrial expression transcriptional regulator [Parashewanella hymeniacidonis]MBM7070916.1 hypothetical protein [Parashewanella hymeniacidonis]